MQNERQVSEQATGCYQHGKLGAIFNDHGVEFETKEAAIDAVLDGNVIEIPNAGAGSYVEVFSMLGFKRLEVLNWSSSAGDWQFMVYDGEDWRVGFQENRYPYHGFRYSIGAEVFKSKEQLIKFAESY